MAFFSPQSRTPSHDYSRDQPYASPARASYLPSHLFPGSQDQDDSTITSTRSRETLYPTTPSSTSRSQYYGTPSDYPRRPSTTSLYPSTTTPTSPAVDRDEGPPPAESIYDDISRSPMAMDRSPIDHHRSPVLTSDISEETNRPHIKSAVSPRGKEGLFRDKEVYDDRWVIIFGFPSSMTSFVLRQFQKYGEIIKHKVGEGNWITVQYASKLQAQKALSKNGKIIADGLMIGVVPCIDKGRVVSANVGQSRLFDTQSTSSLVGRLFRPTQSSYAVDANAPKNVPRPYNSWWGKVSEYVFGV